MFSHLLIAGLPYTCSRYTGRRLSLMPRPWVPREPPADDESSSSDDGGSNSEDDALSLAESLNWQPKHISPPPPPPADDPIRLVRVLGASGVSHLAGAGRERLLMCGAGAVWTLGPGDADAPRFLPVGVAGRHGVGAAPVDAAACSTHLHGELFRWVRGRLLSPPCRCR